LLVRDLFRRALEAYALKIAALTFVRPRELRHATWAEFNLDATEWRIPGERMKMREQHVVPLSRQAIDNPSSGSQLAATPGAIQFRNFTSPLSSPSQ
jgi:integrase